MAPRALILAACLAASPAASRAAPAVDFEPLARLVEASKRAAAHPSGTAIVVVRDGGILYQGYFGQADIRARVPVTARTPFYIASATKPLFALSVLLEEASGRLDTRATLRSMFPDARFAGFDPTGVTVGDLLVHTSGLDNEPLAWATAYSGLHDPASLAALVAATYPHASAPHGSFDYSNVGYIIASAWTSRELGLPWQRQLQRTVFAPLRMRRSTAYASRAGDVARPYSLASATPDAPLYLQKVDQTMHAAGGVIATAPDLARLLVAQLDAGRVDGRQVCPGAVIARSPEDQARLDERYLDFARTGYAWGWYTGEYKQRRLLHHFGGFAGTHAHLSFMPGTGIGLVVLNNEDTLAPRLTSLVADYVYGQLLGDAETGTRVAARFAQLDAEIATLRASLPARRAALEARRWQLRLPRAAYAGRYRHPLLGDVTVRLDAGGGMHLAWGRVASRATAVEAPDQVRVEFSPNSGQVVQFTSADGRVASLAFAGMRFDRVD